MYRVTREVMNGEVCFRFIDLYAEHRVSKCSIARFQYQTVGTPERVADRQVCAFIRLQSVYVDHVYTFVHSVLCMVLFKKVQRYTCV